MSYNFYDFNNAIQQRNEYVEEQLHDGSPVVALSYDGGVLVLTLRTTQRKVFEIYDRLIMGALGRQSDIESIRLAAIDSAHREGFQRSDDDVSIQRLVGFGLSPAVKQVYNDQRAIPLTLRAVFAEVNHTPDEDHFFALNYDGEFRSTRRSTVAGGTPYAEEQATESLAAAAPKTLNDALKAAVAAWGIARTRLKESPEKVDEDGDEEAPQAQDPAAAVRDALADGWQVEAAILERDPRRESRFRLLTDAEIAPTLAALHE